MVLGAAGAIAAGGVTYGLVEHGGLPGRSRLDRALGRCDTSIPPSGPAGPVVRGRFASARRRRDVSYTIGTPPGGSPAILRPGALPRTGIGGPRPAPAPPPPSPRP